MIIGEAFRRLFKDMYINVDGIVKQVRYDHSNQDELEKFIRESDKEEVTKYPLVFYVTANTESTPSGWLHVKSNLIIMMGTRMPFLSRYRTDESFIKHIGPVYEECLKRIKRNPYVTLLGDRTKRFSYMDRPNYGITEGGREHNNLGTKQLKSVITDYVDARIIDIYLRIKPNCIN